MGYEMRANIFIVTLLIAFLLLVTGGTLLLLIGHIISFANFSEHFVTSRADLYSYITALTAGILSLVGLVAVFVAINSQHTIQKCRELLWEMQEMPFEEEDIKQLSKWFRKKIWMYCQIISSKEEFTFTSIRVARLTIITVVVMWLLLAIISPLYKVSVFEYVIIIFFTIVCSIILTAFYIILGNMADISKAGKLPTPSQLLDVNYPSAINTLFLFVNNTNARIEEWKERKLFLETETLFWNYYVSVDEIKGFKYDKISGEFIGNFVLSKENISGKGVILANKDIFSNKSIDNMFNGRPRKLLANIELTETAKLEMKVNESGQEEIFYLGLPSETDYIEISVTIGDKLENSRTFINREWYLEYSMILPKFKSVPAWAYGSSGIIKGTTDSFFFQFGMERMLKYFSDNGKGEEYKEKQKNEIKKYYSNKVNDTGK